MLVDLFELYSVDLSLCQLCVIVGKSLIMFLEGSCYDEVKFLVLSSAE